MAQKEQAAQQVTISVESLKSAHERLVKLKEELEQVTANQQRIRKEAVETLKNDDELKALSESIINSITELLEPYFAEDDDGNPTQAQRVLPLLEDSIKDYSKRVGEAADNFVAVTVKEEATEAQNLKVALKEQWEKAQKQYTAQVIMLDMMNIDHSEVPAAPQLARGAGAGTSNSGSGTRAKSRDFQYVFTKDGKEMNNWADLSRLVFYSTKGCGGSGSDGRFTTQEFKALLKEQNPDLADEWAADWTVTLPNDKKTVVGFKRQAAQQEQAAE